MAVTREKILKDLLIEIDDICRQNNMKYTLTGKIGRYIYEKHMFPSRFYHLTIAMTDGDIERLIEIVNSSDNNKRSVEYILNNKKAKDLSIRYFNNETTLINIKELFEHNNYGIFIKIKPISKFPNKVKRKNLKLAKTILKGSQKRLRSCKFSRFIPVLLLKIFMFFVRHSNYRKILHKYNKRLTFFNKIEDLYNEERFKIGFSTFKKSKKKNIYFTDVDINDEHINHRFMISPLIVNKDIEKVKSKATIVFSEMVDTSVPFNDYMNDETIKQLTNIQKSWDDYIRIVTKANNVTKVIHDTWNIYLMTVDLLKLKKFYNKKRIRKIEKYYKNKDYKGYKKEMRNYLKYRRKYNKNKFIDISALEEIIVEAKKVFN